MYNEDIKKRFINEFTTGVRRKMLAEWFFNAIEPSEREWGADICTVDRVKLQPVLSNLSGLRVSSARTRLSIMAGYIRWCIANHIPGACDEFFYIDRSSLGKDNIASRMVANPQHLLRYMNCIFEPESEHTKDDTFRCYYWLAYGGMLEDDALQVTTDEVDLAYGVIRHNGREYPIYREGLLAFKNCSEYSEFRSIHPNHRGAVRQRADGNLLLRGFNGDGSISQTGFRNLVARKKREKKFMTAADMEDPTLNLSLAYNHIWLSGLFYRTYEAERAGIAADFKQVANDLATIKAAKRSAPVYTGSQDDVVYNNSCFFMKDYIRWKDTYSI